MLPAAPIAAAKAAFRVRSMAGMPMSMAQKQGISQIVHAAALKRWNSATPRRAYNEHCSL